MQKLYLTIGLMITSLSLYGMELGTGESVKSQKIDYTVSYKPVGGYLLITPQTRNLYQEKFETFGIKLDDNVDKVISVQPVQQLHKNKIILVNSKEYIQEHPHFLPLNVFTQGQTYTVTKPNSTNNNTVIKLKANAGKQTFFAHEELLNFTLKQNNHNNKQSPKIIAAEEAKRLQEKWNKQGIETIASTGAISPKEEKNQNNPMIEQARETIHLSKEQINLCEAIKDMYEFNGNEKIAYPLELGKEEETKILFELLDQSLLLNTTGLEQQHINHIMSNLNKKIQELKLETLIKIISLVDYYRVVTMYEEKEIKAPSLLTLEFVHRMVHMVHTARAQYLQPLNNDLQQSILKVFIPNYKLSESLKDYYVNLTTKAQPTVLGSEEAINNCIFYAFSCDTNQQVNNIQLTLEKALLVYDILQKKDTINNLKITDDNVTTMVKIVLDACKELQKIITQNEEAKVAKQMRLTEENQKKLQQETIDREKKEQEAAQQEAIRKTAKIKFNSWPERTKRFLMSGISRPTLRSIYKPLISTTVTIALIYLYYHPEAFQNYLSSFKNIVF